MNFSMAKLGSRHFGAVYHTITKNSFWWMEMLPDKIGEGGGGCVKAVPNKRLVNNLF